VITAPLPRTAPLWAAVLITGLADDRVALVIVLHHAMADGIGGLAILADLVDAPPRPVRVRFPRPAPTAAMLARDALADRLRALGHAAQSWQLLRASMGAGGGLRPPRAALSSLNQRTGSMRSLAVVRAELATLRAAAHRNDATVNDAILVAVAGALHRVLRRTGESVDPIVMAVPVSGRGSGNGRALGNMVSPLLVPVPVTGDMDDRLRQVADRVRARKAAATGPPPLAVLGWLFRPLAAVGGYRWYMNHQHRVHTLVSHVRGPADDVAFGGCRITSAIPVAVSDIGSMTVTFEILSYAGTVAISVIPDPQHFPAVEPLADALRAELTVISKEPDLTKTDRER
jgi:diacylglycerol O-acyltransferase